jgi:hypothetical protein
LAVAAGRVGVRVGGGAFDFGADVAGADAGAFGGEAVGFGDAGGGLEAVAVGQVGEHFPPEAEGSGDVVVVDDDESGADEGFEDVPRLDAVERLNCH